MDKQEESLYIIQMRQKVFFHMLLYNRVECQFRVIKAQNQNQPSRLPCLARLFYFRVQ